jgi:hypothetical protein
VIGNTKKTLVELASRGSPDASAFMGSNLVRPAHLLDSATLRLLGGIKGSGGWFGEGRRHHVPFRGLHLPERDFEGAEAGIAASWAFFVLATPTAQLQSFPVIQPMDCLHGSRKSNTTKVLWKRSAFPRRSVIM